MEIASSPACVGELPGCLRPPTGYVRATTERALMGNTKRTREEIIADIATLKRELDRTDLTDEQRADIREEIGNLGLGVVIEDSFRD